MHRCLATVLFIIHYLVGGGGRCRVPPERIFRTYTTNQSVADGVGITIAFSQEKNGGTLNIHEGATVTFMGTAGFSDNTIMETTLPPIENEDGSITLQYIGWQGAALYNEVNKLAPNNKQYTGLSGDNE